MVFSSKKMQLNVTEINTVEPLIRDTVVITQSVTLSNVKYENGTKFQSWINAIVSI